MLQNKIIIELHQVHTGTETNETLKIKNWVYYNSNQNKL